jgi:hypothetical protein
MVCLFLGITVANAGWEAAGPGESNGGGVQKFAKIGNSVFVLCEGLYRSDDCGRNWHLLDNHNRYAIYDMVTNDSCIFLEVENHNPKSIWIRSKNKGETWEKCNTNPGEHLSASGNMVFKIGTGKQAVFSYDYGDTWNTSDSCKWGQATDYVFFNEALFTCTDSGVFVSKDRGNSWVMNTSTLGSKFYPCGNNKLFLITGGHSVAMLDGKTNQWKPFSNDLKESYPNPISGDNEKCYLTMYPGIVKLSGPEITSINFTHCLYADPTIMLCDSTLLLGTDGTGMFRSDNDGQTWEPSNNGINEACIKSMVCYKGELYASSRNEIFKSADNGNSWKILGEGLPLIGGGRNYDAINSIDFVNDTLLAGANRYYDSEDTSTFKCYSPYSLFKFIESKNQWVSAFDSLGTAPKLYSVSNILRYKNFIMYVHVGGIARYDTITKEWSECNSISTKEEVVYHIKDSLVFVGNNIDKTSDICAINLNSDCKRHYVESFTNSTINSFASIGDVIFASGLNGYHPFFIKSIDNGKTWIQLPIPFEIPVEEMNKDPYYSLIRIACLGSYKNILLADLYENGFCFSADTGKTWSKIPTPPMFNHIDFFTHDDKYLYAAGNGIWRLPLTELETTHTRFRVRTDSYLKNYQVKNDKLYLHLNLHSVEDVSISMFNLQGKLINKIAYSKLTQGRHEIVLNNKNLTSSCSIIKIKVGSDIKCLPVHYFR